MVAWSHPDIQTASRLAGRQYVPDVHLDTYARYIAILRGYTDDVLPREQALLDREQGDIDAERARGRDVNQWQRSQDMCRAALAEEVGRRSMDRRHEVMR